MHVARFHAARDIRVEQVAEPSDDLAPGQVLVKNGLCGICGTDLHEYVSGPIFIPTEAHTYTGGRVPQILGHEYGGVVQAVGKQVTSVKPGDRVSIQPMVSPRDDYYGRRGQFQLSEQLGIVGLSHPWGGMAEYSVVEDYNAIPIPDELSLEQAALIEPTAVAVYAAQRGGIKPGDSVLVAGAGPIGQLQVLAARAAGATQIFLSDLNDNRLRMARAMLGDVITLNPRDVDVIEAIREQTEGHVGVDVALECVGVEATLGQCIAAVRRQGVVVQVGMQGAHPAIDGFTVTYKDIDIRGSWCYSTLMWPKVANLIASGILPAEKVITKRIKLQDVVAEGFEALLDKAGMHLKILIDVAA
ncbi:(R,R)-butanediol dehydrogenase / meso-butanediol dehydrogenase / diacetyl reductase [Pseudomonas flavescens]|uniref:(R,R)-butanediol dehydrogenase / meso-butanediol dehydrogenase / diacetyl reductase n=1 Tax=Phytopseudomonas flavescens TaxID=29435 RepID=A0A1G8JHJ6_9GAMM|nr:2,3-butanediol dehydrogenase [Pseudomonas flavescens]SDI30561.1 (R,R)-butanediol dehydrogenase / meso-butanediol dehydrogenase / diacetyl reductase [Pseudomonas flavescens]